MQHYVPGIHHRLHLTCSGLDSIRLIERFFWSVNNSVYLSTTKANVLFSFYPPTPAFCDQISEPPEAVQETILLTFKKILLQWLQYNSKS